MANRITESTLIPISLVLTLIGGVVFVTTLYSDVKAQSAEISAIQESLKTRDQFERQVLTDLTEIKTELGIGNRKPKTRR